MWLYRNLGKFSHFLMEFYKTKHAIKFYDLENICLQLYIMQKEPETTKILRFDGIFQIRHAKTPKEKRLGFGSHLGHFHPWWRGDKLGNPLKVNIS